MTAHDQNYLAWKAKPDFPALDERQTLLARTFIERIVGGEDFAKPLYRHQVEAILRVIYCGEKLNDWDVLLDIVTGKHTGDIDLGNILPEFGLRPFFEIIQWMRQTRVSDRAGWQNIFNGKLGAEHNK